MERRNDEVGNQAKKFKQMIVDSNIDLESYCANYQGI
jgi:hypothetical protein